MFAGPEGRDLSFKGGTESGKGGKALLSLHATDGTIIRYYKEFAKLREDAGLPKVVFHSLRHSSTTYKLKLNHGDLKATQGDTGHAEIDMITSVYAHILDEDRKINAQKFESAFYANPNLREVHPPEEPREQAPAILDLEALVEQLRQSPELANTLAALLSAAPGGR